MPTHPPIPFSKIAPKASQKALDLLSRMLEFDPEKRITVQQALEHPYISAYHDDLDEPTFPVFNGFDNPEYSSIKRANLSTEFSGKMQKYK